MDHIAEIRRRLDNMIRPGTIYAVDHANARCRVKSGALLTQWLPWFAHRAGAMREWSPPSLNEQCVVFSPSGEMAAGFVLVGVNSAAFPAPASSEPEHVQAYADGTVISYDRASHTLTGILAAGGRAVLSAPGGVHITGNVTIVGSVSINGDTDVTGTVTSDEDVIASGISLTSHTHGGVQGGNSSTGGPQ